VSLRTQKTALWRLVFPVLSGDERPWTWLKPFGRKITAKKQASRENLQCHRLPQAATDCPFFQKRYNFGFYVFTLQPKRLTGASFDLQVDMLDNIQGCVPIDKRTILKTRMQTCVSINRQTGKQRCLSERKSGCRQTDKQAGQRTRILESK